MSIVEAYSGSWAADNDSEGSSPFEALVRQTKDLADTGAWASVYQSLRELRSLFAHRLNDQEAKVLRRDILVEVFTLPRLRAVCEDLAPMEAPPERAVVVMTAALEAFPHDGFIDDAVAILQRSCCQALREALMSYIERFADAHGAMLCGYLATLDAPEALRLLGVLRDISAAGIAVGLRSPYIVVRLQALSCMKSVPTKLTFDDLDALLVDIEPQIRQQTLEIIAENGLAAAGLAISRRIQSEAFHQLAEWERKLLLEAAWSISPRRAEALAMEILDEPALFQRRVREQSQVIAAEMLGRSDSPEALEVVEKAAQRWWRASAAVRSSAAQAAQAIARRRSSRPPRAAAS